MIDGYIVGSFEGTAKFAVALSTVENYVGPLIKSWAKVLIQDNRRGVLAGKDKNDRNVMPTHYRRSFTQAGFDRPTYVKGVQSPDASKSWLVNTSGTESDVGGFKGGVSANLSKKEYQKLAGPPLAPRGMASRIISNYIVRAFIQADGVYGVEGGWNDVVAKNGYPFLYAHFNGTGMHKGGNYASWIPSRKFKKINDSGQGFGRGKNLPRRDMNGLREWGRKRARADLNAWIRDLMTTLQTDYFTDHGHVPDFIRIPQRRRGTP